MKAMSAILMSILPLLAACGNGADLGTDEGWPKHGRTDREERFSPLDQIHEGNVNGLGLVWTFETGTYRGLEATPIVVDGVMYTTASWSIVFALDARSGEERWRWDPQVPRSYGHRACCDVINRGVAHHQGRIYAATLDGRLAALDAASGEVLWEVLTVDPELPYTISGAPRVVEGRVIIGNSGAEYAVRGYVSAYDGETGEQLWRFYTVPGDPSRPFESPALERAAETWGGEWWKTGGGGTVWDSMAHDPELDLLYVGTGNGGPWNRRLRSPGGGDNLFLASILALRPGSGELVWHYQTTPGDSWDYTATQHMILADLEIGGAIRKVLLQAPKNGFFYVLDRASGELISAEPYVPVNWALGIDPETGRPVEAPGSDYGERRTTIRPGPLGGHNWHPMSFSPGTGLVYVPAQELASSFAQELSFEHVPGTRHLGVDIGPPDAPGEVQKGYLLAWDPVRQREVWRVAHPGPWNGGTLATAGNLVFQGTGDGHLAAYRATNGEKLWEAWAGSGVIAPPVSYQLDGVQYVSLMAGWGGAYPLVSGASLVSPPVSVGRVLTFALDGTHTLPPAAERPAPPSEPLTVSASPSEIARGGRLYARWCDRCHGPGASSGGLIRDLRHSNQAVFDAYPAILLEGLLLERGMPSFQGWLDREEVDLIRSFVMDRSAELRSRSAGGEQKP